MQLMSEYMNPLSWIDGIRLDSPSDKIALCWFVQVREKKHERILHNMFQGISPIFGARNRVVDGMVRKAVNQRCACANT